MRKPIAYFPIVDNCNVEKVQNFTKSFSSRNALPHQKVEKKKLLRTGNAKVFIHLIVIILDSIS